MRKFELELHPEKTRLIRFGRLAGQNCHKEGRRKPETLAFLGFMHICGRSSKGSFLPGARTGFSKLVFNHLREG
jgi:hypothetical protein